MPSNSKLTWYHGIELTCPIIQCLESNEYQTGGDEPRTNMQGISAT